MGHGRLHSTWGAGEEWGAGDFATNLSDLLAPIIKVVLSLTEKALKRKTGKQTAA